MDKLMYFSYIHQDFALPLGGAIIAFSLIMALWVIWRFK